MSNFVSFHQWKFSHFTTLSFMTTFYCKTDGNLAAVSKLYMQGWIFIFITWVLDGYLRCSSSSSTFSSCQVRRGHGCPILAKAKSKLCAFRANWKAPVSVWMWEQLWRTQWSSVCWVEKKILWDCRVISNLPMHKNTLVNNHSSLSESALSAF